MKDDLDEAELVAAHQRAADIYEAATAELLALAKAKGIAMTTIGPLMERERDGDATIEDVEVWAAIRKANAAYLDVTTLAKRLSLDGLTASSRNRQVVRLKAKLH